MLAWALPPAVSPAQGATLEVGAGARFSTIAEAIAAAAPGDEISVGPGEYRGNLVVDKALSITGTGMPKIIGEGKGTVVLIKADGVRISGFEISGSGLDMMKSNAGVGIRADRAVVAGNRIIGNLFGVYFAGSDFSVVENNVVVGRKEFEESRRGPGIHLFDSRDNIVRGNDVSYVRDGVYFDHADRNLVVQNKFYELRYGVHYMFCGENSFRDNVFRDSTGGVAIMYTERVELSGNYIYNNRKSHNSFGILLKDCLDCTAEKNAVVNNGTGILMDNSHRNLISSNLVAYNDVAVQLFASSLENGFSKNDFVGNLAVLHTVGRAKADWSPGGAGNFYSDAPAYDLDGDGAGDVPHRLQDAFEYLEGNHPLLRIYLGGAAADALALAERAFPVIESSDQYDDAPMVRPVSGVEFDAAGRDETRTAEKGIPAALSGLAFLLAGFLSWRLRR